jgi:hypothetical protein
MEWRKYIIDTTIGFRESQRTATIVIDRPDTVGKSRKSHVAQVPCVLMTSFGWPVEPEECRMRIGSQYTSAYLRSYTYFGANAAGSESNEGSCSHCRPGIAASKVFATGSTSIEWTILEHCVCSSRDTLTAVGFRGDGRKTWTLDIRSIVHFWGS